MAITKQVATGVAALDQVIRALDAQIVEVVSVTVKFSAAPTTAQNLTITLDSDAGNEFDTLLYSVDPSVGSVTSIVWWPDEPFYLHPGDALKLAYTNTDTRTYGVTVTLKGV